MAFDGYGILFERSKTHFLSALAGIVAMSPVLLYLIYHILLKPTNLAIHYPLNKIITYERNPHHIGIWRDFSYFYTRILPV